ncbi:MAG: hypothetical protein K2L78_02870, partial [Muribaculaceae bacterium]|nr:hypothetical protein [Muribaculaceae bacterium]
MISYRSLTSALAALCAAMSVQALTVTGLHTQHLTNPVGVDAAEPLFSWILESDKRNVMQQSYQIVVATDPGMSNVVWDSGVVASGISTGVKATGFMPQPSTRYYWRVTVSSNSGETAVSPGTSYFETGLMDTGWSGAQWIKAGDISTGGTAQPPIDTSLIKDYTVEADFEIERVAAGIIWGATDHNNYYMWQFNIERNPSMFRPHRWDNGGAACLDELEVELKAEQPYHLKIEVTDNGTLAKTYLDDVLIDTRAGTFPYGDMGVRSAMAEYNTRYYETSYYDNFKVTSGGKVLFEDTFSNRDNFDNGKIVGGQLRVSGDYITWQRNFVPDADVRNYTVEGQFTIDQVAAGICFAGIDDSHFYMWQFNL